MKFGMFIGLVGRLRPGAESELPVVAAEPKPGWIPTVEAARLLGVKARSVRLLLHRAGVRSEWVRRDGVCACLYWDHIGVLAYPRRRDMAGDLLECVPEGWMLASEAGARLQMARSSLSRMAKSGLLTGWFVRLMGSGNRRRVCLFNRREVELLAKRRAAALRARLMMMGRSSCVIAFAHAAIALALVVNAACGAGWRHGIIP